MKVRAVFSESFKANHDGSVSASTKLGRTFAPFFKTFVDTWEDRFLMQFSAAMDLGEEDQIFSGQNPSLAVVDVPMLCESEAPCGPA
mmetsp:Transcript_19169/g.29355  ORF Transcript_19169/g.29355 Transcript_19169/m.29355 type:complete len:87 (+) Transcript_19169:494-754(+)|eukprot:CAMPEP_0170494164 /NCGR_PEP_ID=MMETSP0208-20121228/14484_1 /TAXON_ID=197538 /ORGANISM="Strombidium inclinatum, Strain S3" /LENGTH=86 /DNA_ID=CAMNT_0010770179 /DNA_START=476 /DNA_END=736 /DNA_ORIENTATION=-